jgi:cell division initiation protein
MPIRPIDIRRKEFKNGFRGYDANQVDDFLDAVADEFERNYTENQRMREEVSSLRDRLQQFEDLEGSIRAALVHAEQASNDLRRAATQEAEDVRQSAQREADFTIREAQTRSHQMLADSSARIERVQESYEALQEAKRGFANDFRHLLKTYMDMMENMEVSSAREIEASLRERLDTESIAVVREAAAQEGARVAEAEDVAPTGEAEPEPEEQAASEQEVAVPEEEPAAFTVTGSEDPGATQRIEPEAREDEFAAAEVSPEHPETTADVPPAEEQPAEEQPTEVLRTGEEGPLAEEPETEEAVFEEEPPEETVVEEPPAAEPEVVEPEVEPSTAQGETVQEAAESEPEAADEVEREEPALAEERSSQEFFDREEGERGDSRIFRASRFLRRRE